MRFQVLRDKSVTRKIASMWTRKQGVGGKRVMSGKRLLKRGFQSFVSTATYQKVVNPYPVHVFEGSLELFNVYSRLLFSQHILD